MLEGLNPKINPNSIFKIEKDFSQRRFYITKIEQATQKIPKNEAKNELIKSIEAEISNNPRAATKKLIRKLKNSVSAKKSRDNFKRNLWGLQIKNKVLQLENLELKSMLKNISSNSNISNSNTLNISNNSNILEDNNSNISTYNNSETTKDFSIDSSKLKNQTVKCLYCGMTQNLTELNNDLETNDVNSRLIPCSISSSSSQLNFNFENNNDDFQSVNSGSINRNFFISSASNSNASERSEYNSTFSKFGFFLAAVCLIAFIGVIFDPSSKPAHLQLTAQENGTLGINSLSNISNRRQLKSELSTETKPNSLMPLPNNRELSNLKEIDVIESSKEAAKERAKVKNLEKNLNRKNKNLPAKVEDLENMIGNFKNSTISEHNQNYSTTLMVKRDSFIEKISNHLENGQPYQKICFNIENYMRNKESSISTSIIPFDKKENIFFSSSKSHELRNSLNKNVGSMIIPSSTIVDSTGSFHNIENYFERINFNGASSGAETDATTEDCFYLHMIIPSEVLKMNNYYFANQNPNSYWEVGCKIFDLKKVIS